MREPLEWLRRLYRRRVASTVRQRVRRVVGEIPIRIRDLPSDLREKFNPAETPLPPPRLRARVGKDSSRAHYLDVGRRAAADILSILGSAGAPADYPRWLDFGCGSGRVARHLVGCESIKRLTGIDVDVAAIRWSAGHLDGDYAVVDRDPPTNFPDGAFDLACAVSVFTHFDREQQLTWLAELRRLLRPGGLLIASTHNPALTFSRPDMTVSDHEQLRDHGFVFRAGIGPFNEDSAFHSKAYLEREWSRWFDLVSFVPFGLGGYLDLSVWRRR